MKLPNFFGNPLLIQNVILSSRYSFDDSIQPKIMKRIGYTQEAVATKYFIPRKSPRLPATFEIVPTQEPLIGNDLVLAISRRDKKDLNYALPKLMRDMLVKDPHCFDKFKDQALYVPIRSDFEKDKHKVMLKMIANFCQKGIFWYWCYQDVDTQFRPNINVAVLVA